MTCSMIFNIIVVTIIYIVYLYKIRNKCGVLDLIGLAMLSYLAAILEMFITVTFIILGVIGFFLYMIDPDHKDITIIKFKEKE